MSEDPASAAAPASVLDDENILREILLRLPPLPSSLPRASIVSKLWRRVVADPYFLRRFRAHHQTPPLLGFFVTTDFGRPVNVFAPALRAPDRIPPARFSFPPGPGEDFSFLDCRHGLVLLRNRFQAVVWDPVTSSRSFIDLPLEFIDTNISVVYLGAVLRDCGSNACKFVMISYDFFGAALRACIYDSDSGIWGIIMSTVSFADCFRPSVLVGNKIFWLINYRRGTFIQIDMDTQSLALIQISKDIRVNDSSLVQALRTPDGGLGLALVSEQRIQVWERTTISNSGHVVGGVLQRTVELEQLLSRRPSTETHKPLILGYDENNNVIFLRTAIGVFMIQLESMKFTKVSDDTWGHDYFPFTSFYTPGCWY